MKAKLSFTTEPTQFGQLYSMRVKGGSTKLTDGASYFLYKSRPAGVQWAGPVYRAENGTAWRIGRDTTGALIAWKSVKIGKRMARQSYKMRGAADRKSDVVVAWSRYINGKAFEFSKVSWAYGGHTIKVTPLGKTAIIHEWDFPA